MPAGRDVEPAFQNIAGQMAAIKAMRARTRLLPPGALPARERAVQRIDEGFWRQARSLERLSSINRSSAVQRASDAYGLEILHEGIKSCT